MACPDRLNSDNRNSNPDVEESVSLIRSLRRQAEELRRVQKERIPRLRETLPHNAARTREIFCARMDQLRVRLPQHMRNALTARKEALGRELDNLIAVKNQLFSSLEEAAHRSASDIAMACDNAQDALSRSDGDCTQVREQLQALETQVNLLVRSIPSACTIVFEDMRAPASTAVKQPTDPASFGQVLGSVDEDTIDALRRDTFAFDAYEQAAEQEDAVGLARLANMYRQGWSVPRDRNRAAQLYERAARVGYAPAQLGLGELHEEGIDTEQKPNVFRARNLYERAAAQGLAAAQYRLGSCLLRGAGNTQSGSRTLVRAVALLKQAVAQGNAAAQTMLGVLYLLGRGVAAADKARAQELFELAADQGHAEAQVRLGKLIAQISSVAASNAASSKSRHAIPPQADVFRAAQLFQKAASQGSTAGLHMLAWCAIFAPQQAGVQVGKAMLEEAVNRGDVHSCWLLGLIQKDVDKEASASLLRRASEMGSVEGLLPHVIQTLDKRPRLAHEIDQALHQLDTAFALAYQRDSRMEVVCDALVEDEMLRMLFDEVGKRLRPLADTSGPLTNANATPMSSVRRVELLQLATNYPAKWQSSVSEAAQCQTCLAQAYMSEPRSLCSGGVTVDDERARLLLHLANSGEGNAQAETYLQSPRFAPPESARAEDVDDDADFEEEEYYDPGEDDADAAYHGSVPNDPRLLKTFIDVMKRGVSLTKYSRGGVSKPTLTLEGALRFECRARLGKAYTLPLEDIVAVRTGKSTEAFRLPAASTAANSRCLSIIGREKTLNFETATELERDAMVQGLKLLRNWYALVFARTNTEQDAPGVAEAKSAAASSASSAVYTTGQAPVHAEDASVAAKTTGSGW